MIDYQGKVALVTGAASGIGEAIASALAKRGASVLCADRDFDGAQHTVQAIAGNARALSCDLANPDAAAKLVNEAHELCGCIDLIVSNAGIGHRSKVATARYDEDLARLFEINLFAAPKIAQAYCQQLKETGRRGRLMVTASENSLSVPRAVRNASLGFYGASKHALLAVMEWLRVEQQDGPLDLHVLMPGAVYTPLIAAKLPDPDQAPAELELIMPEECAALALTGMDLGLFYIPTQAHLLEDMQPRLSEVASALKSLGVVKT